MNNSFFSRFAPKEPKFFVLLKSLSDVLLEATNLLVESLQYTDSERQTFFYHKIKEKEREGDRISNEVFDQLSVSFLAPFDREDIHALADFTDDVIDRINSSAKRIAIYKPKRKNEDFLKIAAIIKQSAECIGNAMDELVNVRKNAQGLKKHCGELHDMENEADDIYETAIIKLFEEEKDGIELIKTKEILNELEKATDSAEHVGKILKTIIVKYA